MAPRRLPAARLASSALLLARSQLSLARFSAASDGVSVRRSARRGCSREPHTGQGFPASKVSARIPAWPSRKARFIA